MMKAGGFSLRKWKTENAELAREIEKLESAEGREKEGLNVSYGKETLDVPNGIANDKGKVLGLTWSYNEDILEIDFERVGKNIVSQVMPTKRGFLSIIASLFDPLGL